LPAAIAFRGTLSYAVDWRTQANYGKIFVINSEFAIVKIIDFRPLISGVVPKWWFPKEQRFQGIGGIEFDKDGNGVLVYPISGPHFEKGHFLILKSFDGWKSAEISVNRGYPILQHKNGADLDSILLATMYWRDRVAGAEWGGVNDLFLEGPINNKKKTSDIRTLVAKDCMGYSVHSGGTSSITSYSGRHYITYIGTPRKKCQNPIWVVTIEAGSGAVAARDYLGCASGIEPDSHASPVLVLDDLHRLHVIMGAHGGNFFHVVSAPLSKSSIKWQRPLLLEGRLTYADIVKMGNGNLLLTYRKWYDGVDSSTVIPLLTLREFSVQNNKWLGEVDLVRPSMPFEGYGIFYNHTILGIGNRPMIIYRFKDEYSEVIHAGGLFVNSNKGKWKRIDVNLNHLTDNQDLVETLELVESP
jgi:hypothetical protein